MNLKTKIKGTFVGTLLVSYLHCIESVLLPLIISDEKAVKRYFKNATGRVLDMNDLKGFCDKLNWYKLHDKMPLMQQCADKYAVRQYVEKCGFSGILNELYGVYYNTNEIDLNKLPNRFVLKATHGSHMNIVYPDTKYSWAQCKMLMNSWLHQNIYWCGREWVYKDMPKRIIAEQYLEDETGELRDYKFFCYHGVPHFMQFDMGRTKGTHYRNYYDMDLKLLEVSDDSTKTNPSITAIDKDNFEKMKQIAAVLSKPFQFVRSDFYLVNNKIYFGELTFFDGGGYSGFSKEEYDVMFGEPWVISL